MASRKHILLEFGLFACLLFFCCIKAELKMEKTQSPIRAELGQNVTLPCLLTGDHNLNLDLNNVGNRWNKMMKNGNEIYVYRFINLQHNVIRNGSSIDEREMRRGNFSLTLQHVRTSDEGEYSCAVFIPPNKYEANFAVQVFAQPDVTLSTTELTVVLGSEKTISCDVSKYYPEKLKIRWLKHSKRFSNTASLDKATYFTVPEENSDETFSVASVLTVKPSSLEENGDIYSCNVEHATYSHGRNVTFTLKVQEPPLSSGYITLIIIIIVMVLIMPVYLVLLVICLKPAPPKISDITGLDDLAHGKSTTLSCMVSGFKPREITILFWVKRDDDIKLIGSWVYREPRSKPKPRHEDTVDSSRTLGETAINMKSNKHSSQMESESQPKHEDTVDASRSPEEMALNPIPNKRSSQTKPESKPRHVDTVYSSKYQEELITMIHKIYPFLVKLKPLKLVKSYFSYSCFCFADILTDIEEHKGAKLIITVTHRALKSPLIVERALQITGDFLRLSMISAPQSMKHGEQVTLTCKIFTGSKQPLHITWIKKDLMGEKPPVTVYEKGKEISDKYKYTEAESRGHVFCTFSSITFTLNIIEDHETKYICQVSNPAISQTLQSSLDTFVTAEPKVEQIQSSQKEPCVGRPMELSCRIHSFNPKDLIVCWYKEDVMLACPESKLKKGEDGLFSTTSILSYIPMIEDKGKKFKCRVDHRSFTEPKVCFWKMENLSVDAINH